jgi:aspartyl-tRNA(Asn)/glutamyl-tRNA(Gln) amidotransferase subunit A
MNLSETSICELAGLVRQKKIKSEEVVTDLINRIETGNSRTNAYVNWNSQKAINEAVQVDNCIAEGKDPGILSGIPIAIKDLICVQGEPATCGSHILKGFISPYNATVIENIRKNGGIPFGRTNMDEFAMGSSNETSFYGYVRNPWDLERAPGGSSGGSAASVADGTALAALGSDTGGSIRQPASLCGVVGLKPTYGRVSRYGLIAFASSLDQIGPLTNTVKDTALLLEAIEGHDPKDSTSANVQGCRYLDSINKGIKGMSVGIPREYFQDGLDPDVEKAVINAIEVLKTNGAQIKEVDLPHTKYAVATYYIVATAEASSNLARYDGVQYGYRANAENLLSLYEKTRSEGFGAEVKRRIILGTYVLSSGYYDAYYLKAQKVRTLIKNDFEKAFKDVDALITPTAPTPAFRLGEKTDDPLQMYLSDIFTISANLSGIPGISIPCGLSSQNLPIGVQILGPAFGEKVLFKVSQVLEEAKLFDRTIKNGAGA